MEELHVLFRCYNIAGMLGLYRNILIYVLEAVALGGIELSHFRSETAL